VAFCRYQRSESGSRVDVIARITYTRGASYRLIDRQIDFVFEQHAPVVVTAPHVIERCQQTKGFHVEMGAPGAPVRYQNKLWRLAGTQASWYETGTYKVLYLVSPAGGLVTVESIEGIFTEITRAEDEELQVLEDEALEGSIATARSSKGTDGGMLIEAYEHGPVAPPYRGMLEHWGYGRGWDLPTALDRVSAPTWEDDVR
jgi:hypothetical protein